MDGDDEDSCPTGTGRVAPIIPNSNNLEKNSVAPKAAPNRSTPAPKSVINHGNNSDLAHLAPREQTAFTSTQLDITNFNYGGAVDSQDHSARDSVRHDPTVAKATTHIKHGLYPTNPAGWTQGETQFSSGTQSYQAGTYESHPPATTGRTGPNVTASTRATGEAVSFALRHDLPIINVAALSHLHELQHIASAKNDASISVLAVVFEVGELKELPRRRNEGGAPVNGHGRNLKLCTVKICQPSPDGKGRMAMVDVTMWGDMADRIFSGDYRLVKGDIVWFNSRVLLLIHARFC